MALERATAGTGAVLSLYAIGRQDAFLSSSNIEESFWKYYTIQHTDFTLYYKSNQYLRPNGSEQTNWPFGETLNFDINSKTSGDVLANCFLKLTLPGLVNPSTNTYCDQVGRAIIKEYSFRVGDQVIQTIPGDWDIIHDELYSENSEKKARKFLYNAGEDADNLPYSPNVGKDIPLYLPLQLFFSRQKNILPGNRLSSKGVSAELENPTTYTPYFLLCACENQQITFSVTFNPITFFSNVTSLSVPQVTLVTEEASLSKEERDFYRANKQTMVYNNVSRQPTLGIDNGAGNTGCPLQFKNFLTNNLPVKCFHWFMRDQRYEDASSNTYFLQRYNFCSSETANVYEEYKHHIMTNATLYLNGNKQLDFFTDRDNTDITGANYFKYAQSLIHRFSSPIRNIYSYSFAINPRNSTPTGSLNFSVMDSSKTLLTGNIKRSASSNSYNLNMMYLGYTVLKYENGFCQLSFL